MQLQPAGTPVPETSAPAPLLVLADHTHTSTRGCTGASARRPLCFLALVSFFPWKQRGGYLAPASLPTYSPTHSNAHLSRKQRARRRVASHALSQAVSPGLTTVRAWGRGALGCRPILQKEPFVLLNHEILFGEGSRRCYWEAAGGDGGRALCSVMRVSSLKSQLILSVCPSSSQPGASALVPLHNGPTARHRWKVPLEGLRQPRCLDCSIKHRHALVTLPGEFNVNTKEH